MAVTPLLIAEAIERINCYAVGVWLEQLAKATGHVLPTTVGPTGQALLPRTSGLVLKIGKAGTKPGLGGNDLLFLAAFEGDATVPMPLGLDVQAETPVSAGTKLSQNTVGGSAAEWSAGDRRVSFFMSAGRVIELRFNASGIGFDRILVARLGESLDWRAPANR